jgi:hypothetical protein
MNWNRAGHLSNAQFLGRVQPVRPSAHSPKPKVDGLSTRPQLSPELISAKFTIARRGYRARARPKTAGLFFQIAGDPSIFFETPPLQRGLASTLDNLSFIFKCLENAAAR